MVDFVAGIDGGGTKTSLICADLQGKELFRKTFSAFNINSVGKDNFLLLLNDICDTFDSVGRCVSLCVGAAGVSNEEMKNITEGVFKERGVKKYTLVGDHIIALEGAHEGKSGLAVIAGTGSICFGKGKDGKVERAGGWGHIIGDAGSAYSLGRDLFSQCAKELDGYASNSILPALLKEKFGLSSREEIINYVYSGDKTRVADVAPLVDIAFKEGDGAAIEIIRRNALELVLATCAVAKQLNLEECSVALFGGLIDKDTPLRKEYIKALAKQNGKLKCILPKRTAVEGALLIALRERS